MAMLCALTTAVMTVVLPGAFVYQLIRRRRWTLRMWLALPVLVALVVFVPQTTSRYLTDLSRGWIFTPEGVVLSGTLLLPFPALLILWTRQRYWLRIGLLVTAALILSLVITTVTYVHAAKNLQPFEGISWDGWYNVFWIGALLAGWPWQRPVRFGCSRGSAARSSAAMPLVIRSVEPPQRSPRDGEDASWSRRP
jgi:hypothetical protein